MIIRFEPAQKRIEPVERRKFGNGVVVRQNDVGISVPVHLFDKSASKSAGAAEISVVNYLNRAGIFFLQRPSVVDDEDAVIRVALNQFFELVQIVPQIFFALESANRNPDFYFAKVRKFSGVGAGKKIRAGTFRPQLHAQQIEFTGKFGEFRKIYFVRKTSVRICGKKIFLSGLTETIQLDVKLSVKFEKNFQVGKMSASQPFFQRERIKISAEVRNVLRLKNYFAVRIEITFDAVKFFRTGRNRRGNIVQLQKIVFQKNFHPEKNFLFKNSPPFLIQFIFSKFITSASTTRKLFPQSQTSSSRSEM